MTIRIGLAFDGGLATSGMVAVATNGLEHQCLGADVFESESLATKLDIEVADDRVRRTQLLTRWIESMLRFKPSFVAAERMSFPRGTNAIVAISLAWGVLASFVERHRIPLVVAGPRQWRWAIADGTEDAAHRAAIRTVPSFAPMMSRIDRRMQPHVLDAAGVYCWSVQTNLVRGMLMR